MADAIMKLVNGDLVAMAPGAEGQVIGVVDGEAVWVDGGRNIDGGSASTIYTAAQVIDGGGASG